jgi:hypothetical protein
MQNEKSTLETEGIYITSSTADGFGTDVAIHTMNPSIIQIM